MPEVQRTVLSLVGLVLSLVGLVLIVGLITANAGTIRLKIFPASDA